MDNMKVRQVWPHLLQNVMLAWLYTWHVIYDDQQSNHWRWGEERKEEEEAEPLHKNYTYYKNVAFFVARPYDT